MSHRCYIKPDVLSLKKILHLAFKEVGAIICDNVVWKTETEDHLFDELNRRGCVTLAYWLRFNPFSELVNRHQQVGLLIFLSLERPYHVKPPSCKRLGDRNHP